ncbi:Putative uncharacterized protein YRF1, partial [Candida maltosa Xu316]
MDSDIEIIDLTSDPYEEAFEEEIFDRNEETSEDDGTMDFNPDDISTMNSFTGPLIINPTFMFFEGFLINQKTRKVVYPSPSTINHFSKAVQKFLNEELHDLNVSAIILENDALFRHVNSGILTLEKRGTSYFESKEGTRFQGVKVNGGPSQSVFVITDNEEFEVDHDFTMMPTSGGNAPDWNSVDPLDRHLSVNFDDESIAFFNSTPAEEIFHFGKKAFNDSYNMVIGEPVFKNYMVSSFISKSPTVPFIRTLSAETRERYSTSFGFLVQIFVHFNNQLTNLESLQEWIVESIKKTEYPKILSIAMYKFNAKKHVSTSSAIQILNALKLMIRYTIVLTQSHEDVADFIKTTDFTPNTFIGYCYIVKLYHCLIQHWMSIARFNTIYLSRGVVVVDNFVIKKSFLTTGYQNAIESFTHDFNSLTNHTSSKATINTIVRLFNQTNEQTFFTNTGKVYKFINFDPATQDVKLIQDLISSMLHSLAALVYICLANSSRYASMINLRTDRNIKYVNGRIIIITTTNKTGVTTPLVRFLTHDVSRLMIVYIWCLKPLLLKTYGDSFPNVQINKFLGPNLLNEDENLDLFYKTFLFSTEKGVLSLYSFSKSMSLFMNEKFQISKYRQAISSFMKNDISLDSAVANIKNYSYELENFQAHSLTIGESTYGGFTGSSSFRVAAHIANAWAKYLNLEDNKLMSKEEEQQKEEKVADTIMSCVSYFDLESSCAEVGFDMERGFKSLPYLFEIMAGSATNVLVKDVPGSGKSFGVLIPILTLERKYRERKNQESKIPAGKKLLHMLIIPYRLLKSNLQDKFSCFINIIDFKDIKYIHGDVDLIILLTNDLGTEEFNNFIQNFDDLFGSKFKLGILFIDEIHLLISERSYRGYDRTDFSFNTHFVKTIGLSATVDTRYKRGIDNLFGNFDEFNLIKSTPNPRCFLSQLVMPSFEHSKAYIGFQCKVFQENTDGIIVIYFSQHVTLQSYKSFLKRFYPSLKLVEVSSYTTDDPDILDIINECDVILATKSINSGFDNASIKGIIIVGGISDTDEYIQLTGRCRSWGFATTIIPKESEKCFRKEINNWLRIGYDGHMNCCNFDSISDSELKEFLDTSYVSERTFFDMVRSKLIDVDFREEEEEEESSDDDIYNLGNYNKWFAEEFLKAVDVVSTFVLVGDTISNIVVTDNPIFCSKCFLKINFCNDKSGSCKWRDIVKSSINLMLCLGIITYEQVMDYSKKEKIHVILQHINHRRDQISEDFNKRYKEKLVKFRDSRMFVEISFNDMNNTYYHALKGLRLVPPTRAFIRGDLVMENTVDDVERIMVHDFTRYKGLTKDWYKYIKNITITYHFKMCYRCGADHAMEEECPNEFVMFYFFVIFHQKNLKYLSSFEDGTKIYSFQHWILNLGEYQHQKIFLKAIQLSK